MEGVDKSIASFVKPRTKPKQDENAHSWNDSAEIFSKHKKLLDEVAAFARAEGFTSEHAKPFLAQIIDDESNLQQSRDACDKIAKLLQRNSQKIELIDMRLETVTEILKKGAESIEFATVANNISNDLAARFEAFKSRLENEYKAVQQKFEEKMGTEDAFNALQNALNHLLRHKEFGERAKHLQKMQDDKELQLKKEYDELSNHIAVLNKELEIKNATNAELQQQFSELNKVVENMLSADVENLDDIIAEENNLKQQFESCKQAVGGIENELAKLSEDEEKFAAEEQKIKEEILNLEKEIENLNTQEIDDFEEILQQHKSCRENAQAEINEQIQAVQKEIDQAQAELNNAENQLASLKVILGNEQRDWLKELEGATAVEERMGEALSVQTKANEKLSEILMEKKAEYAQIKQELNTYIEEKNAQKLRQDSEISELRSRVESLIKQQKEEIIRYKTAINSFSSMSGISEYDIYTRLNKNIRPISLEVEDGANMPAFSGRYSCMKNDGEVQSNCKDKVVISAAIADVPSEETFKRGAFSRPQWVNITNNATHALSNEVQYLTEAQNVVSGAQNEPRYLDAEVTRTVPSDINTINGSIVGIAGTNANLNQFNPLPSSISDHPGLLEGNTCNEQGDSNLDYSVWTDISSMMK